MEAEKTKLMISTQRQKVSACCISFWTNTKDVGDWISKNRILNDLSWPGYWERCRDWPQEGCDWGRKGGPSGQDQVCPSLVIQENGTRFYCVGGGVSNTKLNVHVLSRYEQNILEKESFATMEKITDSIHLAKEHTKTDAEFYKVTLFLLLLCPQISSTLYQCLPSPDSKASRGKSSAAHTRVSRAQEDWSNLHK